MDKIIQVTFYKILFEKRRKLGSFNWKLNEWFNKS